MEFSGVVEEEDLLALFGEEFLGFGEESEMSVAVEDVLQVADEIGLGLNRFGSRAFLLLALFSELFGGFGDEEGGGVEGGGEGENVLGFRREYGSREKAKKSHHGGDGWRPAADLKNAKFKYFKFQE